MRAPRTLTATLAAALLFACRATAPSPWENAPAGAEPVLVVVTNLNWATVEVYAVASGRSNWLGMVETGRTDTLKLPGRLVSALDVHLDVQPIGTRAAWTSDVLVLTPGVTIELTVENNLALTHYTLYE